MKLLGIRLGHEGNISFYDGQTLHYLKTERLTQKKHDSLSIDDLEKTIRSAWGVSLSDIDEIAVVDNWKPKTWKSKEHGITIGVQETYNGRDFWKIHHHYAHALSLLDDTVNTRIVIDGVGIWRKCLSTFKGDVLVEHFDAEQHGSIGLLMNELSSFCGCRASYQEDYAGKLMGLQSYGKVDSTFLAFLEKYSMEEVKEIFNFKNWVDYKKDQAEETKLDFAATVHERIGDVILDYFKRHVDKDERVFYSGGVAQNVVWNTKLKNYFTNLVILPYSSDEGLSLGAVEWLRIRFNLPKIKLDNVPYCQSDESVETPSLETIKEVAKLLAAGKIVAWYQGSGEIGPRALGARSILMDPRIKNGKEKINAVKRRESYRPFGASVLLEHKDSLFDMKFDNPYMLYIANVLVDNIQSITHVDNTCRVQTVENNGSPFRTLLEEFYSITGCPVLLNTSLNLAGNPIAGKQEDAMKEFRSTNIDVLVVGDRVIKKQRTPCL